MNWFGIVVLGAAVGGLGWWLHPARTGRRGAGAAVLTGVVAAVLARMAGNVSGLFHDGGTLEWPVCTAVALGAVAVVTGVVARR